MVRNLVATEMRSLLVDVFIIELKVQRIIVMITIGCMESCGSRRIMFVIEYDESENFLCEMNAVDDVYRCRQRGQGITAKQEGARGRYS